MSKQLQKQPLFAEQRKLEKSEETKALQEKIEKLRASLEKSEKEKETLDERLRKYMNLLDQKERTMLAMERELNDYKSLSMVGLGIKLRNYKLKIKKLIGMESSGSITNGV